MQTHSTQTEASGHLRVVPGLRHNVPRTEAAVTIVALISLVVISIAAASVLRNVAPRYHVSHQTAGWQEARLAAEAGVDLAIERLNKSPSTVTFSAAEWTGWRENSSTAATGTLLAKSNATAVSGLTATGNALTASPTIYLDNVDVSPSPWASRPPPMFRSPPSTPIPMPP